MVNQYAKGTRASGVDAPECRQPLPRNNVHRVNLSHNEIVSQVEMNPMTSPRTNSVPPMKVASLSWLEMPEPKHDGA